MITSGMGVLDNLHDVEEAFTVRRAFGDPYEKDGVTVITAAKVHGGLGGGGGEAPEGQGSGQGSGFGLSAKPFGVFVMNDGDVTWRPAVDVNRVILGGQIVGIVALWVLHAVVRMWAARAKA